MIHKCCVCNKKAILKEQYPSNLLFCSKACIKKLSKKDKKEGVARFLSFDMEFTYARVFIGLKDGERVYLMEKSFEKIKENLVKEFMRKINYLKEQENKYKGDFL